MAVIRPLGIKQPPMISLLYLLVSAQWLVSSLGVQLINQDKHVNIRLANL